MYLCRYKIIAGHCVYIWTRQKENGEAKKRNIKIRNQYEPKNTTKPNRKKKYCTKIQATATTKKTSYTY